MSEQTHALCNYLIEIAFIHRNMIKINESARQASWPLGDSIIITYRKPLRLISVIKARFKASEAGRLRSVQTWCSQLLRRLPRGRRQPPRGGVSSLAAQQAARTDFAGTSG